MKMNLVIRVDRKDWIEVEEKYGQNRSEAFRKLVRQVITDPAKLAEVLSAATGDFYAENQPDN